MDTEQFLARVVAPGNFVAIGYNRKPNQPGNTFSHQFFPEAESARAARFAKWCASKGMDAYHAMASYVVAEADGVDPYGHTKYRGERKQSNTQRLKSFWVDLDVKRAGDKKKPGAVYNTQADALAWLKSFMLAIGMPRPNLAVNSGYGLHIYWVLEDPLLTQDWQPYADALKAALLKHNFLGDPGISNDAARILRPPGTSNMKSGVAMPVLDIPRLSAGDYPNELILAALEPYVGLIAAKSQSQTMSVGATSALAGGGGAVVQGVFAGKGAPNMSAAASANLTPTSRPRDFAPIAARCEQVKLSLAEHGEHDSRSLWYLGHLTLAHFTVDGGEFVHLIGDKHPKYTKEGTDAEVARIAAEHLSKGMGPPPCANFDAWKPNVCPTCPHHTRIHSPWDLGVDDGDLPENYRRGKRGIEVRIKSKDEVFWTLVLAGDVHTPTLDELPMGGYALQFVYQRREGKSWTIRVTGDDLSGDPGALFRFFQTQFLVLMNATLVGYWRDFVLGWIDKLREQRAERTEVIHPFGWSRDADGVNVGYAVGGTLYTPDGREVPTPGGDPMLVKVYKPLGTLAAWQQAAAFVMANRLDLQVLVAASFGAPLMVFTGHAGLVISAWSRQSAVGKSSGIRVGQSIWSAAISMNSIDDTNNFVLKKVADVRSMPCYWDEMKVGSENSDKMVSLALSLSQGKGKGRMNADTSLKEVGEWDTILVAASNFPLMDHIVAKTDGTDAGAVRLFEFAIERPPTPDTSQAARIIAQTKTNYGHAGRVFAKWISANYDKTDQIVCLMKDQLNVELHAEQSERFYIAGMAATLAGARLANHLGICTFDLIGLKGFMCTEFMRLRAARQLNVVVSQAGYDLEQVLSSFMSDNLRHKLVTKWFATPGPTKLPQDFVAWRPQDSHRVDMHVGQQNKVLRINRSAFTEWCRKKNYPTSDVIAHMGHVWGATVARKSIASGTGWGGGQLHCIDVPLVIPALEGYLYADPNQQAQATPTAKPKPTPGAPGNKPKV